MDLFLAESPPTQASAKSEGKNRNAQISGEMSKSVFVCVFTEDHVAHSKKPIEIIGFHFAMFMK